MNYTSPIADLSYRSYDGPLESPTKRWWVISKSIIQLNIKKKAYWIYTLLSGGNYMVMMIVLYFVDMFGSASVAPGGKSAFDRFLERIVWEDQFVHGFSMGQIWYLMIALLIGAGAIANDNRTNALLIYLSKPCEKSDYVFGKWFGIFLLMLSSMLIPSLFFYAYGALSYQEYGFLKDKALILKILISATVMSAFYSSIVLGVSSFFKQGRIAGATMAGLYFITNSFTQLMTIIWADGQRGFGTGNDAPEIITKLFYASIDGLGIGFTKGIIGTDGSPYFGIPSGIESIPSPGWMMPFVIMLGVSLVFVFAAWRRVRAVEVIG